jgi:hypothetical protein
MMQCLKEIVGVTTIETECITGGLTAEQIEILKKSNSGLFMDDLPGGVHLKAVKYADATKGLYQMAIGARDNAIKTLEDDLVVALNKNHAKSRKNYVGQIGRMSFAQTLAASNNLQGLRLRPVDYSDAVIIISRIMIIINTSATFPVSLYKVPYKSSMGELVQFWNVTTTANAFATVMTDPGIRLPLTENGGLVEYWLVWDRSAAGGALPKDNKLACGTCEKANGPATGEYLQINGVDFSDLNNLQNALTDDNAHGLILDVTLKCDSEQLFCNQYKEDDAVAVTMAHAVRFKAGELLIEDVLKSPDLNRYTTMDKERLWGKRNHFRAEYQGRIDYLAEAIDITASNCYVCREAVNQPFAAGIFS